MESTNVPPSVSIGILARNEVGTIDRTLKSLFFQTIFAELAKRGKAAEIRCVVNGSTDATAKVSRSILKEEASRHPHGRNIVTAVDELREPGKMNAWNVFVHELSASGADYLILMDADIVFLHSAVLWNLLHALEDSPNAGAATGVPIKDLAVKERLNWTERLSLATSRMTQADPPQLTGQLYCIRSDLARHIRLPRDLTSCDDGFIKNLICTDFGTKKPDPSKIAQVRDASHIFGAYVSFPDVLKNQKRQMMAQAFLHVLLDQFIPSLATDDRRNLSRVILQLDTNDPNWLRMQMKEHLQRVRYSWRLFPGVLTFRFRRLRRLPVREQLRCLPAAIAGFLVTLVACWLAARALRKGEVRYWPERKNHHLPDSSDITPQPRMEPPREAAQRSSSGM